MGTTACETLPEGNTTAGPAEEVVLRLCAVCNTLLTETAFGRRTRSRDGLSSSCKRCCAAKAANGRLLEKTRKDNKLRKAQQDLARRRAASVKRLANMHPERKASMGQWAKWTYPPDEPPPFDPWM